MNGILISIIVTNYNYSRYIRKCIKSCLTQKTNIPYEILVVDDGSTDNSIDIIKSFKQDKLRLLQLENRGVEAAANIGISESQGVYIVRVDADDFLLSNYIESMMSEYGKSELAFAYPDYFIVDENDSVICEMELPEFKHEEIYGRGDFLATGTVYKREIIDKIGRYDETVKNCGLENYYLILKLLQNGYKGLHINKKLFSYRRHSNNLSEIKREKIIQYGNKIMNEFEMMEYHTNIFHPYGLKV